MIVVGFYEAAFEHRSSITIGKQMKIKPKKRIQINFATFKMISSGECNSIAWIDQLIAMETIHLHSYSGNLYSIHFFFPFPIFNFPLQYECFSVCFIYTIFGNVVPMHDYVLHTFFIFFASNSFEKCTKHGLKFKMGISFAAPLNSNWIQIEWNLFAIRECSWIFQIRQLIWTESKYLRSPSMWQIHTQLQWNRRYCELWFGHCTM